MLLHLNSLFSSKDIMNKFIWNKQNDSSTLVIKFMDYRICFVYSLICTNFDFTFSYFLWLIFLSKISIVNEFIFIFIPLSTFSYNNAQIKATHITYTYTQSFMYFVAVFCFLNTKKAYFVTVRYVLSNPNCAKDKNILKKKFKSNSLLLTLSCCFILHIYWQEKNRKE